MNKRRILRFLALRRARRIARSYDRKTDWFVATKSSASEELRTEHVKRWKAFSELSVNSVWFDWYSNSTGFADVRYVPESVYYSLIEPILNDYFMAAAWADKNIYDLLYPEGLMPRTLARRINGQWFDHAYRSIRDIDFLAAVSSGIDVIVKPSIESGGG